MIKLISSLPDVTTANAEYLKIKCLFDNYKEDNSVYFWSQDNNKAFISLCDGNMIIKNNGGNTEEIKEFISVMSPNTVFSDFFTLSSMGFEKIIKINVMSRKCDISGDTEGDTLSSREIYEILNIPEFSLPDYPFFAVDFCRRLNRGNAAFFGIKYKCAAVSFSSGEFAIINGIVSREKGFGSLTLKAILQKNYGRNILACCEDDLIKFYEKNGFKKLYDTGCWNKNEHKQFL